MKKIILLTVLFASLCACRSVPMVGRKQISLYTKAQIESLSATAFKEALSESKLSTNVEQTQMLNRVGGNIRKAVEGYFAEHNMSSALAGFSWDFILIDDPTVNAWAMPGARIAFYTGILPICLNEDGIAVVMGHEIAHAVFQHGNERMSQAMLQQFSGIALSVALANTPDLVQALANTVFGLGSNVFGMLPYNRKREYEADEYGLKFMAMAGYNPEEGPKFWERMMARSGRTGNESDFLSTHPANHKRIEDMRKKMPDILTYYKGANNEGQSRRLSAKPIPIVTKTSMATAEETTKAPEGVKRRTSSGTTTTTTTPTPPTSTPAETETNRRRVR